MNSHSILGFLTTLLLMTCLLDVKLSRLKLGAEQRALRTVSWNR